MLRAVETLLGFSISYGTFRGSLLDEWFEFSSASATLSAPMLLAGIKDATGDITLGLVVLAAGSIHGQPKPAVDAYPGLPGPRLSNDVLPNHITSAGSVLDG